MSENRGKPRLVIAWQHGSLGGAQIYLIGLARELSQTFETLFLIPSDSPATTIAYLRESGLTYLQTELGKELTDVSGVFGKIGRHIRKLRSDIRFVRAVLTNSVESDVLHVELTPWQSMLALLMISKFRETFCTVHNRVMEVSETRKTLWRFKFWCLGNLSRIRIFATNKDAKDFLDELSTSELKGRILVVPTSADMACATPVFREKPLHRRLVRDLLSLPEDTKVVLTVGQFIDRKGRWTLIDSIPKVAERIPNITFLWLSDTGAEPVHLERLSAFSEFRLISPSQIGLERTDVFRILAASDVFVLPSFVEGLPIALLEAMGMGIPCISSDINGIPEAIAHRESGLLTQPGDSDDLADRILEVLLDDQLSERLASQGRQVVIRSFSESVVARLAEGHYLNAVRNSGGVE